MFSTKKESGTNYLIQNWQSLEGDFDLEQFLTDFIISFDF